LSVRSSSSAAPARPKVKSRPQLLPIQIAFEPLRAGLAGLVAAGAVQAAAELPESR
jgi:hypothetical protein